MTESHERIHERAFDSQREDLEIEVVDIEGALPTDLIGVLLRNGPGAQSAGDDAFNFFDGHGYVAALTFPKSGAPTLVAKHVRTPVYKTEHEAGRQLRRRNFTNMPARTKNIFNLDFANTASHDVYLWGGHVLAALEPGHFALDRKSLDTLGEHHWKGAVPEGHNMCPMPRVDAETGRLVGYSVKVGRGKDEITFHELDDAWKEERRASYDLARSFTFIHDLAFTREHYVVVEAPLQLSVAAGLWGARTAYDAFEWPEGATSTLVIFDRTREREPPRRLPFPGKTMALHLVNAFERDDEIVVDAVVYDDRINFQSFSPSALRERQDVRGNRAHGGRIARFTAKKGASALDEKILSDSFGELPEVRADRHGKKYRFAYFASPGAATSGAPDELAFIWFSRIMKLDVESGATSFFEAPEGRFVSQPAFAPRGGPAAADDPRGHAADHEDDGYLLFWELDLGAAEKSTSVVVLDAKDLSFRARLDLGAFLPPVSHTSFWP